MKRYLTTALSIAMLSISLIAQDFAINPAKSQVKWKGEKLTGTHTGLILVKDGSLMMQDDRLSGVNITIDMTSIQNTDLDEDGAAKLEGHLKSPDFFDVDNHGTAMFEATNIEKMDEGYEVTGDLTIKGTTEPVTFMVETTMRGESVYAEGSLVFDRSKYDVRYGSKSFFDDIGDRVIYDDVELMFSILATK